jgi:hypothetical protein
LTIRWFEEAPTRAGESGSKLVGEWIVENPGYQPPALRAPEPLPITQTNNSLLCTLEHAFFGLATPPKRAADASRHPLTFSLAGAGEEAAVVLVPRITSDSPGEKWEVASVVLRDISGNQVAREPLWLTVDETYCSFAPALWPTASWEVNVFAKRHVPFHLPVSECFSPEELLVFKDVKLTGPRETALDQELGRSGARLRLSQFTLRPPQDLSGPWSREDASELRATLSRSTDASLQVNLAGVTDEEGKPHYPRAYGYATGGLSRDLNLNYSFPTLALGGRKLTITFVIQRAREFTFCVKPEIPTSPVSLP